MPLEHWQARGINHLTGKPVPGFGNFLEMQTSRKILAGGALKLLLRWFLNYWLAGGWSILLAIVKLTSVGSVTLQSSCHTGHEVGNLQTAVAAPGKFCLESLWLMGQGCLQEKSWRAQCENQVLCRPMFYGKSGPCFQGNWKHKEFKLLQKACLDFGLLK